MRHRERDTRRRILDSAYRLFYRDGFQRTGIDAVAEAAGVTKRTLYNHFGSKDALLAAVLKAQADLAEAEIGRWCGDGSAAPEALVASIFANLRQWSRTPDWRGSGFTRAAMELAWAPGHPARQGASVQKRTVERMLAEALPRGEDFDFTGFARTLMLLIEGANALRLIHGEEGWYDAAEAAALALLRQAAKAPAAEQRPYQEKPGKF